MALPHEAPLSGYAPEIGGSAGEYTHGGSRVDRPDDMPTKDDADYTVTDYDELKEGLQDDNAIVYIDDHIDISRQGVIEAGDGVTLVGQYCDPDVESVGNWIRHNDNDDNDYTSGIRHRSGGTPLTLWGVYMLGPRYYRSDEDHTASDFEEMLVYGVWDSAREDDGTFKAVGCRFSGWTHAGIVLGAKNYATDAKVYRCTFDMNNFNHYGYGLEQYNGDLHIDRCFFDNCRHFTAGFGWPQEQTDITNTVGGPGPGLSHAWDKHGLHNNITSGDRTAGHHLRMKNCTTMQTKTVGGGPQEAVKIRGITEETSWFENCHFYHTSPPDPNEPNKNQVIRQEEDEWTNVEFRNRGNHYGPGDPPDGVGAPLASVVDAPARDEEEPPEESIPKPAPKPRPDLEEPTQTLKVKGEGQPGNYWIYIDGKAKPTGNIESPDAIRHGTDKTNQRNCLFGHVIGGTDTWELGKDTTLHSAWVLTPLSLELDGDEVDLAPLLAIEADRKFKHS